jgi:hypothetical protein
MGTSLRDDRPPPTPGGMDVTVVNTAIIREDPRPITVNTASRRHDTVEWLAATSRAHQNLLVGHGVCEQQGLEGQASLKLRV